MASAIENVQGLGLVAVMAGALFLAWKLLQPGAGLFRTDENGDIVLFQGNDPVDVPVYFCESLNSVIPVGLSCPTMPANNDPYNPTTDPNQCSPGSAFCEKQGHCVPLYIHNQEYCDPAYVPPWEQPTPTTSPVWGLVDTCQWPNGDKLTVPPGMNCQEAVTSMCQRFSVIPNYKGCP